MHKVHLYKHIKLIYFKYPILSGRAGVAHLGILSINCWQELQFKKKHNLYEILHHIFVCIPLH